jgi:hypothetical protein
VQQDTTLSKEQREAMATTRATATPLWKGFATLVKYRTARNYRCVSSSSLCHDARVHANRCRPRCRHLGSCGPVHSAPEAHPLVLLLARRYQ